jgi:hypothetical protein
MQDSQSVDATTPGVLCGIRGGPYMQRELRHAGTYNQVSETDQDQVY